MVWVSLMTCLAQNEARVTTTDGLNNGYLWDKSIPSDKMLYVTGLGDGVFLQAVTTAAKMGESNPDTSLYPKDFLVKDIVDGIDSFYKDRANMKVPILFSYFYVMRKLRAHHMMN